MSGPVTLGDGHAVLAVRVTPRAERSAIGGVVTGADGHVVLAVRIAAPPVDGAANAALIALLSDTLGCRKRDLSIVSGEGARVKRVRIAAPMPGVIERLRALVSG